jgi:MFS family permease
MVSDIGTWMQLTVLGVLVAKSSKSALAVGLVMTAQFVPSLIGAPIGGILADRFDRRQVLLRALTVQTLITAVLAVVVAGGERRAWVLALLVLLQGLAVTLGGAAISSMQPDLVPKEELLAAVSLGSASWNSGRVLGPALAFLLERLVGATGAIAANAVSFGVLAIAVWSVKKRFPPPGTAGGSWASEIRFGIRTLWATPGCRAAVQGLLPMQLFLAPLMALLPLMSKDLLGPGREPQGLTSALSTSQGVGAVLGAALIPFFVGKFGRSTTLRVHWVATSVVLLAIGFNTNEYVAIALLCIFGGAFTGVLVTWMALMQRDAPMAARGRVQSIFMACMGPLYGLGVGLQSFLVDVIGRTAVHRLAATGSMVVLALMLLKPWSGWKPLTPVSATVPAV